MHTPWQAPLPELQPQAQTMRLGPGQTMQVWLQAGSQIVCHAPSASVVEAPQWLLDRLVSKRSELADGEALALEHAGWVEIHAAQGGEMLCFSPATRPWYRPLTALLRLFSGNRGIQPARR